MRQRPDLSAVGDDGFTLLEVLVAALVVGITIIGVAVMYGHGTSWMAAMGDDRVALSLAQERIESIRAAGWTASLRPTPLVCQGPDISAGTAVEDEVRPSWIPSTADGKAVARAYRRTTWVQYVDDSSSSALAAPAYDGGCAGDPSLHTKRITVNVVPLGLDGSPGSPAAPASASQPITLQAWITDSGR